MTPLSRPFLPSAVLLAAACSTTEEGFAPEVLAETTGREIVAAGERIFVGAPVVLWTSPDGYDAYNTNLHFEHPPVGVPTPPPGKLRYAPGRKDRRTGEVVVPPEGSLLELQEALELFVVHYDAGATSQSCFRTLHDRRALSVHFMIDLDGTIYQTLDLRDTAWHARQANNRSVGVEIAQIGAYPLDDTTLDGWYETDVVGTRINLPRPASELGVRTPRFVARPARPGRIRGLIHGKAYQQYDFTPEQYDSLVKLTAALCRHFPKIEPDAPRDRRGRVLTTRIPEEAEWDFNGIVGHYHVGSHKTDPGPAFDWDSYLTRVQTRLMLP
ncbi:MAG: peptidoglycan recognition family protein [Planctomycetota bacterium]|nr:peptidoglycan recognition family protein [Planctomycetota bacterium]MEC8511276.1 peptidoglycan recognition family protein [Planctomycetota bacterium]